jgi:hypothetical protein
LLGDYVPIFLERFVLPVLAAATITVIALNPLRFDRQQRISLLVAVLAFAYFVGYTIHKNRSGAGQTTPQAVEIPKKTGDARTTGPKSPAVTGDNNKINYDQSSPKVQKPTKKKE